jgi:hypothetical protein
MEIAQIYIAKYKQIILASLLLNFVPINIQKKKLPPATNIRPSGFILNKKVHH